MDWRSVNAFVEYNHIQVQQTGPDCAEARLEIVPESLNLQGILHGGAYYTLADCASGAACRGDGRKYVTLQGGLNFIRAVQSGTVQARAVVRHRGRTTCLTAVEITDGADTLLATGEFTFFCVGMPD